MKTKEVIFILTKQDIFLMCDELGISHEKIDDLAMHQIKKGVEFGLEAAWPTVLRTAIDTAVSAE